MKRRTKKLVECKCRWEVKKRKGRTEGKNSRRQQKEKKNTRKHYTEEIKGLERERRRRIKKREENA